MIKLICKSLEKNHFEVENSAAAEAAVELSWLCIMLSQIASL